ncbi:MAG: hypothetical protein O3A00_10500 [Planctomycetota bacterium]|nr:hypothetical protein [Planctomycetota bacterium]
MKSDTTQSNNRFTGGATLEDSPGTPPPISTGGAVPGFDVPTPNEPPPSSFGSKSESPGGSPTTTSPQPATQPAPSTNGLVAGLEQTRKDKALRLQVEVQRSIADAMQLGADNQDAAIARLKPTLDSVQAADIDRAVQRDLRKRLQNKIIELNSEEKMRELQSIESAERRAVTLAERRVLNPGDPANTKKIERGRRRLEGSQADLGAARLSISIDVEQPEDHISHSFHYRGIQTADAGGLRIEYQSRESGTVWQMVCLAAVLGVFWVLRNRSTGFKAIVAVVGFSVPLALIGLLPVGLHSMLQGSWVGTLAGLVLWGVRRLAVCVTNWRVKSARKLATAILLIGVATAGSSAFAQNAQPNAVPFNPSGFAQQPNAAAQTDNGPTQVRGQQPVAQQASPQPAAANDSQPATLIIPYDAGTDPLASEHVFLSRGRFLELWNKAHPAQRIKAASPIDGMVTAAVFSAQLVDGDDGPAKKVSVTGRLVLHSFRDGQVLLPLPMGVVALDDAKLDGKPAALTTRPDGQPANPAGQQAAIRPTLHAILETAGSHVLDVRFSLPAQSTGPAGQFSIPLHPVASGRLSFQLPQKDLNVRINGASSIFRRRDVGEQQLVEVATDRGGDLTVAWQPKTARGAVDSVVLATGHSLVHFTDAGVKWLSAYDVTTRQGSLSDLTFSLPEPLKMQGIAGPDVGGWEVIGAGAQRAVRVFLRRKITDQTKLFFSLHHPLSIGDQTSKFELPEFGPREVTRESGTTGFFADGQFVLRPTSQASGQINVGVFAAASAILNDATLKAAKFEQPVGHPKFAYRYATRPFKVSMDIERRKAATEVTSIHGARIETRKVHWTSLFRFDLKGTPRSRLMIYLPDDYVLLEADAQYLTEWFPHEDPANGRVVILELDSPRLGVVEAALHGVISRDPNEDLAELWLPEPLGVDQADTRLAVWIDDSYSAVESEVDGWQSVPPEQLSARHRNIYPKLPQFALKTDELEISTAAYKLTRIAPRVKADVLTVINLTEVSIEYSFNARWTVQKGLADRFSLTTPDNFAGRLRFEAPGLRQVKETKLAGGRVRWELTIQQPTRTAFFAQAAAVLPPVDDTFKTPSVDVESPPVNAADADFVSLGKESQRQFVVLVNQSRDVVEAVTPNAVETIRDADLPDGLTVSGQLLTKASEKFRLRSGRPIPEWRVVRRKQDSGDSAVIRLANLKTVIAADGSWRTKATYTMTNQSRQFLAIELPDQSRLLAVVVQGKPSRAVISKSDKRSRHLIPLPVTSVTDPTFNVELVLAGMSAGGISTDEFHVLGQQFKLPAPKIATPEESAEWGMSVMRSTWNVYVPDDWNVTTDKESGWTAVDLKSPVSTAGYAAKITGQVDKFKIIDNSQSTPRQRFEWYDNARKVLREGGEAQQETFADAELNTKLQDLQQRVTEFEADNTLDAAGRNAYSNDLNFNNFNLDVRGQRLNVEQQNRDLYTSNAPAGMPKAAGEENDRRFRFQLDSSKDGEKAGDKSGDTKGDRSEGQPSKPMLHGKNNFRDEFRNRKSEELPSEETSFGKQQGSQGQSSSGKQGSSPAPSSQAKSGGGREAGRSGGEAAFNQPGDNTDQPPQLMNPFEAPNDEARAPSGEGEVAEGRENESTTAQAWKSTGGLSLNIDIPTGGQVFTFTRMSAAPEIVLSIQPRESANSIFGGVWAVVWVVGGIACLVLIRRVGPTGLMQAIPFVLTAFGLFAAFAFPETYAAIGSYSFTVGAIWLAVHFRNVGQAASA